MSGQFWIFLTVLLFYETAYISGAPPHPIVLETKLGDVRGEEFWHMGKKIRSFLGIPFGEPPIEGFRFKIPRQKKRWKGTFDATNLAQACYQTRDNYNTSFWGSEKWNANTEISEDCLYLNIWAPADAYNLTVMVWFFGGGFYAGSPSLNMYDGKTLASTQNVIIVNINYRLGPFGFLFLDHPEAPGNMGLLDQQLALYWVRDNIVSFGGNPGKVTLFGQNAGAASIVAHMVAPGSRGLFRNVILQSGSLQNQWAINSPYRAKQKSMKLLESVGCNRTSVDLSLACLRLVPAQQISTSIWNISLTFLEFPFVIVARDNNFFQLTDAMVALNQGSFHENVNVMIGMNKDEGNYWNIYNLPEVFDRVKPPELTRSKFDDLINQVFTIQPEIIRSAAKYIYSDPNCTDHSTRATRFYANQMNHVVGDYFFTCDSLHLADQSSSANPWPKWTGAMHGLEIEYVFGAPVTMPKNYKRRERIFSKKVMEYWSSFARNGRPMLRVLKQSESWPEYSQERGRKWMHFQSGSHIRSMAPRKSEECSFWQNVKSTEYTAYLTQEYTTSSSSSKLLIPFILILFPTFHF